MSAQDWAEQIQAVIQGAQADGFDVWIDDDFDGKRLEVRVGSADDNALIMEWNA